MTEIQYNILLFSIHIVSVLLALLLGYAIGCGKRLFNNKIETPEIPSVKNVKEDPDQGFQVIDPMEKPKPRSVVMKAPSPKSVRDAKQAEAEEEILKEMQNRKRDKGTFAL